MLLNLVVVLIAIAGVWAILTQTTLSPMLKYWSAAVIGFSVALWLVVGAAPQTCPDMLDPAASQNGLPAETED